MISVTQPIAVMLVTTIMTISQQFKKSIYPLLKTAGRLFGANGKRYLNKRNATPVKPVYTLYAYTNQGKEVCLDTYRGKFLLIANTASHCGFTAQYAELQQLQDKYAEKLTVLAFPANDFGGQEPEPDDAIANFCAVNFGVKFPVMMKSEVVGEGKNPVFKWLTDPAQNGWNRKEPKWNFCKYLLGPDGKLLGYFESAVSPLDEEIQSLVKG
jgi:glutathione peroxidase